MPEISTALYTLAGGIVLFVLNEWLQRAVLDPLFSLQKLRAEISHSLIYYAHLYFNPGSGKQEAMAEASDKFRDQASALRTAAYTIPCYRCFRLLSRLPRSDLLKASHELIGLSNVVAHDDHATGPERAKIIRTLLHIPAD